MGTLSQLTTPGSLAKLGNLDGNRWFAKRKINKVQCQGGNFSFEPSAGGGLASSVLEELVTINNKDHHSAAFVVEHKPGSLVLTPNGSRSQTVDQLNDSVMDLAPCLVPEDDYNGLGIVKFLRGKNFFITGATGFLAKVLVEKILRTTPDVGKIYLLIKAKNVEVAEKRLRNEIVNTELFKTLRQIHGNAYQSFIMSKVAVVVGDVSKSDVGLDDNVASSIANDVDVIVNSAANTTFDERYDVALGINTKGPCNLMAFAKKCKKLKLFVQVSTAYVNGKREGRVMEKPFRIGDSIAKENLTSVASLTGGSSLLPELDVEAEMKLALESEKADINDSALAQTMKELGLERAKKYGWQDTYVFTKAMGEMVLDDLRGDVPVVVIRPSVIESTLKEPFPGWMEGNRMMDPIILYYGKGQLTGFLVNPDGVLDVVPADLVVNATLAAIARHGTEKKPCLNVYQIASSVVNPLVFEDLSRLLYAHYTCFPCLDSKGLPIQVPTMKLFECMDEFSAHIRQDALRRNGSNSTSNGKKVEAICRKSVEQAKHLAKLYEPYTFYAGRFDNSNTERLMEMMSDEERETFGFEVGGIKWEDYITNVHIPGLRRHVLKGRGMQQN